MSLSPASEVSLDGLPDRIVQLLDLYPTRRAAAVAAGVSTDQITRYAQGRSAPPFEVMARLAKGPGISLDWLATGQGDMRRSAGAADRGEGLPVIGLTASNEPGWYRPRTLGVRLPTPADARPDQSMAVLATDDSLLPEGVRAGFVCYAFRGLHVLDGDLVYIVRNDGHVALRRFDGRCPEGARLSWFDPDGKHRTEVVADDQVELLCAVAKLRRKW